MSNHRAGTAQAATPRRQAAHVELLAAICDALTCDPDVLPGRAGLVRAYAKAAMDTPEAGGLRLLADLLARDARPRLDPELEKADQQITELEERFTGLLDRLAATAGSRS